MENESLYKKYKDIRDKELDKYLTLSRKNHDIFLAIKNYINQDSPNFDNLAKLVETWLDNRYAIACSQNAVMRMNENISISEKIGYGSGK